MDQPAATSSPDVSASLSTPASSADRTSAPLAADMPAIVVQNVSFAFDEHVVLEDVSFTVARGRLRFLLGASGSGKSILLKLLLGLLRPDAGTIEVNGHRIDELPESELLRVRSDLGMVFQDYALFSSLTVGENVGYRLYEETRTPLDEVGARVAEVLGFVGLTGFEGRMPSELSGGQRRRVALARAMATRPSLLLFDDPTTGLDPLTAISVNDEIIKLRDLEDVTSVLVTHQLRDAFYVATHQAVRSATGHTIAPAPQEKVEQADFVMLRDGKIVFEGSADELRAADDPYLRAFLS